MIALIQRVKEARVDFEEESRKIGEGLLVFLGVSADDSKKDSSFLADKILNLRIFEDEDKKMNLSLLDKKGELLIISQFTLLADCSRGRRPSFTKAAPLKLAEELYQHFIYECKKSEIHVETGKFQAEMSIFLINHGPVTIMLDSKADKKQA